MAADYLVSICIPTYNGEKYLVECLDSCINQVFTNYEIVICDDGSTDKTKTILEAYAKKDRRIRLFFNEKNLGLVGNWNKCIEKANGEWIKYVFQDDYITTDCLEKFVSAAGPDTQLIVSERNYILPEGSPERQMDYYTKEVRTLKNTSPYTGNDYSFTLISKIAVENMCMNFIGEPSLIFFRRSVIDKLGYFDSSLKQICDLEFVLRIASNHGLTYIPEKICAFRVHSDSTTSSNLKNRFFELRYLEPIVFAWFLLYGPHYNNLRKALSWLQLLKLKIYFKVKAYEASRISLKEKQNHSLFQDTGNRFKEIAGEKNGSFIVKWISKFRK